mmetsp:Transcript_22403/g.54720  ORF Transcript_22403/g.54720 Transcript_22403/m.54720 type:complete len:290 (-) Transcript_22403:2400-3269(-)
MLMLYARLDSSMFTSALFLLESFLPFFFFFFFFFFFTTPNSSSNSSKFTSIEDSSTLFQYEALLPLPFKFSQWNRRMRVFGFLLFLSTSLVVDKRNSPNIGGCGTPGGAGTPGGVGIPPGGGGTPGGAGIPGEGGIPGGAGIPPKGGGGISPKVGGAGMDGGGGGGGDTGGGSAGVSSGFGDVGDAAGSSNFSSSFFSGSSFSGSSNALGSFFSSAFSDSAFFVFSSIASVFAASSLIFGSIPGVENVISIFIISISASRRAFSDLSCSFASSLSFESFVLLKSGSALP